MSSEIMEKISPYKSTIINVLVKEALKFLVTKASFFAWGPVGWISGHIISWVINYLLTAAIIEIEVKWAASERESFANKIDELIKSYEGETDDVKKDAIEKEIIDNARDLIKLGRVRG